jgi:hypothetical protein
MPRLLFFIISESVSVDQRTNKLSIFNVLEELQTVQFPALLPQCAATSLWFRQPGDEDEDFQCILRVAAPNDEPHDFASNFRMTRHRHRLVQAFQGLPVTAAGDLRFELLLNGTRVAEHIVTVIQTQPLDVVGSSVH